VEEICNIIATTICTLAIGLIYYGTTTKNKMMKTVYDGVKNDKALPEEDR